MIDLPLGSAGPLHDVGEAGKWFDPALFPAGAARPIQVPGAVTEVWASSTFPDPSKNATWYLRTFSLPVAPPTNVPMV